VSSEAAAPGRPILAREDTELLEHDLKGLLGHGASRERLLRIEDRTMRRPFAAADGLWDFASMARWTEQFMQGVGHIQDLECRSMKGDLMELANDGDEPQGKVDIDVFYASHLKKLGLKEGQSRAYVRFLAALGGKGDEKPHAIISNYVYASQMCLSTPSVVALCCINECNGLMDALERRIGQPTASPRLVAAVVSSLPSTTVSAPRNLSASLLRGLDKIAGQHGGQVPVHSRAFASWMYRAFPIECPNPAVENAAHTPWVGEAFVQTLESTASFMSVKVEKLHAYDGAAVNDSDLAGLNEDDLEQEEELPFARQLADPSRATGGWQTLLRVLALASAVVGLGLSLRSQLRHVVEALDKSPKFGREMGFKI